MNALAPRHPRTWPLAIPIAALAAGAAAQQPLSHQLIAAEGSPAPNMPGVTFAALDVAGVNAAGDIALWARLDGKTLTSATSESAWRHRDGALALLARAGDAAAAELGNRPITAIAQILLDETGHAALLISMDDGATPYNMLTPPLHALIRTTDGKDNALIAAEQPKLPVFPPPPAGTREVNAIIRAAGSDRGVLAFSGVTERDGLLSPWITTPPVIDLQRGRLDADGLDLPVVAPDGTVFFRVSFSGTVSPDFFMAHALMKAAPDAEPETIALFSPDDIPQADFADFSQTVAIGPDGTLAFRARTRTPAGLGADAIWRWDGDFTPIIAVGDPAPGDEPAVFTRFHAGPALNIARDLATAATARDDATGTASAGLWCYPASGAPWRIARTGDRIGEPPAEIIHTAAPTVTDGGRVVFIAGLRDLAPDSNTTTALLAASPTGGAVIIARAGDTIDVGGFQGVIRDVAFASESMPDGDRRIFSRGAADTIVYEITVDDRRSAIVATTVGSLVDVTHDGVIDRRDLLAYLDLWRDRSVRAEVDGALGIDAGDLREFIHAWRSARDSGR